MNECAGAAEFFLLKNVEGCAQSESRRGAYGHFRVASRRWANDVKNRLGERVFTTPPLRFRLRSQVQDTDKTHSQVSSAAVFGTAPRKRQATRQGYRHTSRAKWQR